MVEKAAMVLDDKERLASSIETLNIQDNSDLADDHVPVAII